MPSGFPTQLLQKSKSERLAYFRSYAVAHPELKMVTDALLRAIREPAGRSLILVHGPTGVGKTTVRLRVEQEIKQQFLALSEPDRGHIPVIGLQAMAPDSGNFSWKDYYRRTLQALEEPLIDYKIDYATPRLRRNDELRRAMEHALHHRRPAAVLIDEAQHMTKMASGRRLSDQLDCLKSLSDLTGCTHVLIGTYELLPCRNLSAQLSRRSIDIHFRRYRADNADDAIAFQRVIFSFQRHLPLAQEPEFCRDWEYCYARSVGCVGILKDWFTRALAEALDRAAPTLTRTDLERHALSVDQCEKMAKETLEGEAILTERPDAIVRLKKLLSLGEKPCHHAVAPAAIQSSVKKHKSRIGLRNPARDTIGIPAMG